MLTVPRIAAALAAVVTLGAATAGCSGGDDEPTPGPDSADVHIPEGVTLTSGGSTMDVGQSASVVYQPDGAARTVITVRVEGISRGKSEDVKGVEGVPDGAVPFYVETSIHNAGPAALDGAPVPLSGRDDAGDRIDATGLSRPVAGCDPLPADGALERGATAKGCLLFAVPDGTALRDVRLRTSDLASPVTWKP